MKTLITFLVMATSLFTQAQSHQEKIIKELQFASTSEQHTLIVANISGDISVEGYDGNAVSVEIEKMIKAENQVLLEKGIQNVQLGIMDLGDTLILHTKGLCSQFSRTKSKDGKSTRWDYQWKCCDDGRGEEFEHTMNYKIRLPKSTSLIVSTVNNGEIIVTNIGGTVTARNVNGGIELKNMMQAIDAHTINGDVNVTYVRHPGQQCRFYTLNGNINANFPKGIAANVNFKSFNGEFFTNVDQLASLPTQVEKESTSKGTKFNVNGNRFKAGKGGALLDFETFNGNVYLKEVE